MKTIRRTTGTVLVALAVAAAAPAMAEKKGGKWPQLDLDGDGYISPEEFAGSRLSEFAEFSAIDTDDDNLLSKEELRAYMKENRNGRSRQGI